MIVFYPVYYLLCKDEKISNAARRLLMVFCFMRILLEDFTRIAHLDFPIRTFSLIGAYQLFLLLGFELKLLYDKGKLSKRFCLKSGLVSLFFRRNSCRPIYFAGEACFSWFYGKLVSFKLPYFYSVCGRVISRVFGDRSQGLAFRLFIGKIGILCLSCSNSDTYYPERSAIKR